MHTRALREEGLRGGPSPFAMYGVPFYSFLFLDGRASAGVGGVGGRARASKCGTFRNGPGPRKRRVAHLTTQVEEEVHYEAKRDDMSISITASHLQLELEHPGRLSRPRAL